MKLYKSLFLGVAALAMATSAYANDNRIIIQRTDGTNIEYGTTEIQKIDFGAFDEKSPVLIYHTDGLISRIAELPKLFMATPSEAGKSAGFAFGTAVAPDSLENLWEGKYAFGLQLSNSVLYAENVNLVNNTSALLTRYTYEEGKLVETSSDITSGTVTTSVNTKNRKVTVIIDATFEDGMRLVTNIEKRPTEVESIDLLTPPEVFTNELVYFNADGEQSIQANITSATRSTYRTLIQFTFKTEGDYYSPTVQIAESLIGEPFFFNEAPENSINFRFDNIQVSGPNNEMRPQALQAQGLVKDNGDGTWTFEFDVTNKYKVDYGWGNPTEGGTPERVVLYYTGPVTQ